MHTVEKNGGGGSSSDFCQNPLGGLEGNTFLQKVPYFGFYYILKHFFFENLPLVGLM
jgi:hypothetical protein